MKIPREIELTNYRSTHVGCQDVIFDYILLIALCEVIFTQHECALLDFEIETLNLFRRVGLGSRMNFSNEKLVSLGWTLSERESLSGGRKRKIISFVDPSGKKYKTGKDVERYLKRNNLWDKVKQENEDEMDHSGQSGGSREEQRCPVASCILY